MNTIHIIDFADQDPEIPEEPKICAKENCPGKNPDHTENGWNFGYGMAGGGMGPYVYCDVCEKVIAKTQDPTGDED